MNLYRHPVNPALDFVLPLGSELSTGSSLVFFMFFMFFVFCARVPYIGGSENRQIQLENRQIQLETDNKNS